MKIGLYHDVFHVLYGASTMPVQTDRQHFPQQAHYHR
jgi:hypothetical protein